MPGEEGDVMPGLAIYVGMLHNAEQTLAESLRVIGEEHESEPDVAAACTRLATMSEAHVERLRPIAERYGEDRSGQEAEEPERLHAAGLAEGRSGSVGLLRDLQDLHLLATLVSTTWTVLYQAAQGARDRELMDAAEASRDETARQLSWLLTHLKVTAPQALLVASSS